jgi:predicted metal-binding membrane protein
VEDWLYGGTFVALVAGAWAALGLLGASAYAPWFSHAFGWESGLTPLRLLAYLAGWVLMSVAMMLPTSLPLLTGFRTITRGEPGLSLLLVTGYLAIWAFFGAVALLGDGGLHALVEAVPALEALLPGALLFTAGLFQFSPLKYACLAQCRSPIGFVIQNWRGGHRARGAFQLGVRHGVFCIGCCWALMLLMFAVGDLSLGWMLALAAIMFVEKAVPWGHWIVRPVGVLLALWGVALLARWPGAPAPF